MRWFILIFVLCLPEPVAAWPACDGRDLLRGARVTGVELGGDPARLAGGELATEGAPWRGPRAVVLQAQGSSITFDLGGPRDVRHLLVQADANDLYLLRGSLDGRAWQDLWRIPSQAPYEGLRSRVAVLSPPARVRYLRLEVARGDGRHSISGLRAHCRQPWTWPPASVAATAPVELRLQDGGQQAVVTPARVRVLKVTVAVLAALMLLWGAARSWLSRWRKIGAAPPWLRRGALAVLGLTAAACWYNGGKFHFDEYVHTWEVYHYYMGAKYFPELGYTRLYDCAVVADLEAGVGSPPTSRVVRDLRTNRLGHAGRLARDPGQCKAHFAAARWRSFAADAGWFRRQMSTARWEEAQQDHGYNATPLWGVMGRALAATGPASRSQILALTLLDPLLLCAMFGAIWWAFGWRALCLALVFWGTNYPARFFWNGGGFLRQAWLVLSILSICLMRRQRMFGAGVALTTAALLRIFPGLLVVGLVLAGLWRMWQARRLLLTPAHRRFALGCLAALALLVPISAAVNGAHSWPGFVDNSRKHLATPLTNYMGLKTVLAFSPATRARQLKDPSLADPYGPWKDARLAVFSARRPLFALLLFGYLLLLLRAVRGREDWQAAALSVGLIPMATELTCYYMSALLGLALLFRPGSGRAALAVAGLLLYGAATWVMSTLWGWYDEQFTWLSLATVAVVVWVTWILGSARPKPQSAHHRQPAPPPSSPHPLISSPARPGPQSALR